MNQTKQAFRDPLMTRIVNKASSLLRATPAGLVVHRVMTRAEPQFECPACGYSGSLVTLRAVYGERKFAQCPKCGALERHRLMALVMLALEGSQGFAGKDILHFAPEPFFAPRLRQNARSYRSSDLVMRGVDLRADLAALPVESESVDVVIASYILQYVPDDRLALREIHRVLRPGGFAILPVTIVSDVTVEYPEPNAHESGGHVRAPGLDYFNRMREIFARLDLHESGSYPEIYQTYVYEDRSRWPTPQMPLRRAMPGSRHPEYVPICWR